MTWYKKGISFKCSGCGKCCYGFSGYVWINNSDIINISNYLNISKKDFLKKYTRQIHNLLSLKETLPDYACIFLKNKKCTIYKVRPFQCISFPFWPHNLTSKKTFENVLKRCKNTSDKHYSYEEIREILNNYKKQLPF